MFEIILVLIINSLNLSYNNHKVGPDLFQLEATGLFSHFREPQLPGAFSSGSYSNWNNIFLNRENSLAGLGGGQNGMKCWLVRIQIWIF